MRRFVEHDHPRWPRGTGDKSGEFRDKTPDWASRVSEALPAGRYGSVATGITKECPFCGRQVKVVGSGRLSTHNKSKGVRCPGSGITVGEIPLADRTPGRTPLARIPAQRRPPSSGARKKAGRYGPPLPPEVTYGPPLTRVDAPAARSRMKAWQDQATGETGASHAARIAATRQNIQSWQASLKSARHDAKWQMAREEAGVGPGEYWRTQGVYPNRIPDEEADAADPQGRIQAALRGLHSQEETLAALEAFKHPRPFDPTNPLDYYGEQLHIESNDWHTYEVLDELEQRVPSAFHRVAAEYLSDQLRYNRSAGMYVSSGKILDLDDLRQKIKTPPRGWGSDATMATWGSVDGVVSGGAVLAVSYSSNTSHHKTSRARSLAVTGNMADRVGGSAGLHEFGHVLDAALGYKKNTYRPGSRPASKAASGQRRWRLIHGKVKRESRSLSPYFRQKDDAGPEEFWADAFFSWAAVPPTVTDVAGSGQTFTPAGRGRPITRQDEFISVQYGVSAETAMEISDYFTTLHKQVESGARRPTIELVGM